MMIGKQDFRITSYNVCYTKLLRFPRGRHNGQYTEQQRSQHDERRQLAADEQGGNPTTEPWAILFHSCLGQGIRGRSCCVRDLHRSAVDPLDGIEQHAFAYVHA